MKASYLLLIVSLTTNAGLGWLIWQNASKPVATVELAVPHAPPSQLETTGLFHTQYSLLPWREEKADDDSAGYLSAMVSAASILPPFPFETLFLPKAPFRIHFTPSPNFKEFYNSDEPYFRHNFQMPPHQRNPMLEPRSGDSIPTDRGLYVSPESIGI